MKNTKEFYELRDQFEKDVSKLTYSHSFERVGRDEKVPVSIFYNDGRVNQMFHAYMLGYQNGKYTERTGETA